jgi:hypothetical protein
MNFIADLFVLFEGLRNGATCVTLPVVILTMSEHVIELQL